MATKTAPEAHDHVVDMVRKFNTIAAKFVVRDGEGGRSRPDDATIAALAAIILSLDTLLVGLARDGLEAEDVYAMAQGARHAAYLLMTKLNPDQAWFWTEAWQAGEREVDADITAGRITRFESDEAFDAALDALHAERF